MVPVLIGAGLGGAFGALSTYFGNKQIDAMLAQSRSKKEERDAKLLRDKTINADDINDSVAGGIVQSANIAQVQNRGALNIPVVQAIMASRLAGQGATAIGQSNARYDMMGMQDDLMTQRTDLALESSKGNYFDSILQGVLAGAGTGMNIERGMAEVDAINQQIDFLKPTKAVLGKRIIKSANP